MEAALIVNDSPYVEVRAVVSPTDDPNEACSTVRAWTIGILLACFGALINQLFSLRQPSIYVDQIVAQLIAYPLGKFWGNWMPSFINPGKFTRKEHMLITVMANVSFDVGYSGYIIVVQLVPTFFNQGWARNFGYQSKFCPFPSNLFTSLCQSSPLMHVLTFISQLRYHSLSNSWATVSLDFPGASSSTRLQPFGPATWLPLRSITRSMLRSTQSQMVGRCRSCASSCMPSWACSSTSGSPTTSPLSCLTSPG